MQNTPSTNFLHHLSANIKGLHPRHHVWTSLHKKLLHSYSFPIAREKLIQILGIRKVNAKSLAQDRGFGIFSHFSLINHACQSNSIPLIRKEDFALELRAKTFIAKGSEINVTYGQCDVTMGQPLKRETLYRHWDFICTCSSCLTPPVRSLSGVRCNRCYLGISFPIEGHIPGGKWGCDHCGTVYEEGEINILMEDVKLLHHDHYLLSSSCYYSSTKGPTRIQPASLVCM
nr:uncharacterized protein LOC121118585 [Lepeophtheirus salmonis]